MKKMVLIFSHVLTEKQIEDAEINLGVDEFIYLPKDLQEKWSSIPPQEKDISGITKEIKNWLEEVATKGDYVLVQGDYGATYDLVNFCRAKGLKAVYSTTSRRAKEIKGQDGKIEITRVFEHVIFREYF
ncbi:MAG: hypothetical protein GX077_09960 [Tissierellia bacterium]|nr:hypothetical protein [Tissierellia bacterium]